MDKFHDAGVRLNHKTPRSIAFGNDIDRSAGEECGCGAGGGRGGVEPVLFWLANVQEEVLVWDWGVAVDGGAVDLEGEVGGGVVLLTGFDSPRGGEGGSGESGGKEGGCCELHGGGLLEGSLVGIIYEKDVMGTTGL